MNLAHIEEKGQFEMAGLDIHGQAPNVDVESRYELYKTFEIDFENSPSTFFPFLFRFFLFFFLAR